MMKFFKNSLFVLLLVPMSLAAQNTSKYEAPQYFPEMPYDGINGQVDSMVTYTFEATKIHKDSLLKTDPTIGKCMGIKRQYFDQNGRRTLLEELKVDDKGCLAITFREVTQRDDNSLPTGRTITQEGITTHYVLQSRVAGTEIYQSASSLGHMPTISTSKKMTVMYEDDPAEFDMGEGQIETEWNTKVTTTVEQLGKLITTTIDDYTEDGFCSSSRIIKEDGARNQIYDANDAINNTEEGIVSYTLNIQKDNNGNHLVNRLFDGNNILQTVDVTEFFYREGMDFVEE